MKQNDQQLRAVLAKIAALAAEVVQGGEDSPHAGERPRTPGGRHAGPDHMPGCVLKSLPRRLLVRAAETAKKINPVNAPVFGPMAALGRGPEVMEPLRIAVMTSKYWGPTPRTLTVSFLDDADEDLKARILSHMNAWSPCCCVTFVAADDTGDVRISLGPGGYYSYLGTDILHIPKNRQTMNLEGFSMDTPESEYKRVVRHETGHTLGFPHEHMRKDLVARIDRDKAYKWFLDTYGWDQATVDAQVLTPLDAASLMGTPVDDTSIMCYQLPGAITTDGKPIPGGTDINETDCGFAAKIYPKSAQSGSAAEDWAASEDVEAPV